ncbi:hypothetical protein B566_EDAN005041 [Ephemera danica]|nr:hypothetical protein B566_EDAN005041 [Ephemera danica]
MIPVPPPAPPAPACVAREESNSNNVPDEALHRHKVEETVAKLYEWGGISRDPVLVVSVPVQHVLQSGPMCGLVALSMASSAHGQTAIDAANLLAVAKNLGFTNHGEIFSVEFMQSLAQSVLPNVEVTIVTHELSDPQFIAQHVAAGDVFLVPYDSDRNFAPACLQGHKAHWAIVTGVIISMLSTEQKNQLTILPPGKTSLSLVQSLKCDSLHVLALQGKSQRLGAWPLQDLVSSNGNLVQQE